VPPPRPMHEVVGAESFRFLERAFQERRGRGGAEGFCFRECVFGREEERAQASVGGRGRRRRVVRVVVAAATVVVAVVRVCVVADAAAAAVVAVVVVVAVVAFAAAVVVAGEAANELLPSLNHRNHDVSQCMHHSAITMSL
jgi:hypothetical protein